MPLTSMITVATEFLVGTALTDTKRESVLTAERNEFVQMDRILGLHSCAKKSLARLASDIYCSLITVAAIVPGS